MLAIVVGLKEVKWLIEGPPYPTKVYTDHKGILDSMANLGETHGKVARWIDILQEYNIEYIHRNSRGSGNRSCHTAVAVASGLVVVCWKQPIYWAGAIRTDILRRECSCE